MVLVDTSVWIRFLSGTEPFLTHLREMLLKDAVAGHELVYGELLIGDRGARRDLLHLYDEIRYLTGVPHRDVAFFVRKQKLHGRGISWIDAHLLASAVLAGVPVWTADRRFAAIAGELGAGYVVGRDI